jgi:hypothetical protein
MQARAPARQPLTFETAEAQVLANMRAQKIGAATLADLGLPEAFLRRVAGRVLQLSFQENFRLVFADRPGAVEHEPWTPGAGRANIEAHSIPGIPSEFPADPIAPPPSRGFLPRVLGNEPAQPYSPEGDPALSTLIARSLAKDGLLMCAAKVLTHLAPLYSGSTETLQQTLMQAGFPCDLLRHFRVEEGGYTSAEALLAWLQREIVPLPPNKSDKALRSVTFAFQPTTPGFRANCDSGPTAPRLARVQLSRGGYWMGPGDGGSIDVLRQVAESLPDSIVVASIEQRHLDELRGALANWPTEHVSRLRVITHDYTLSQWAQDNAKAGAVNGQSLILMPRYATRGEEMSLYVPGDTYCMQGLSRVDLPVAHSPLLFQGGNLLVVQEPSGRRVLLIGEAEVYRNQSLGLTRDQTIDALTAEMGCDRGVVLPAASIHIDYEVSCRTLHDKVVAFVIDTTAGAKLVVEAALTAMSSHGVIESPAVAHAMAVISQGRAFEGCQIVWSALAPLAVGPGRFPIGLAAVFRDGDSDSGVGNLHRLMAALDLLAASDPRAMEVLKDANHRVYLRSLRKRQEDRAQIRSTLRGLGWAICPLPGLAQGDRSINPLNGLHTTDTYLMPAYGGLYQTLDDAAVRAAGTILGNNIRIQSVRTGESQRRDGALRCSVSLV